MRTSYHPHVITAPSVQELDQFVQEDVFIATPSRPPRSERLLLSTNYYLYSRLCALYYSCNFFFPSLLISHSWLESFHRQ